jgi:hypothetical protein
VHLEERRAAAAEAARAKKAAAEAGREKAPPAAAPILTPRQLANVTLAPVQAPSSLEPSQPAGGKNSSPDKSAPRRKANRARGKSLAVPALIVLLMFAGAGVVVWQVVPQYTTARVADATQLPPANPAGAEAPEVALAETSQPAPAEVSPEPTLPVQAAPEPDTSEPDTSEPDTGEPAAAASLPPEEADWIAAQEVGNVAAFRTYVLKWPEGKRRDQALSAAKRRIQRLSTNPEALAIVLPGPVVYRELPTFRDKGAAAGAAGQTVNIVDRIASPIEGEWLVLEREGVWPFRFISAREIESPKQ